MWIHNKIYPGGAKKLKLKNGVTTGKSLRIAELDDQYYTVVTTDVTTDVAAPANNARLWRVSAIAETAEKFESVQYKMYYYTNYNPPIPLSNLNIHTPPHN